MTAQPLGEYPSPTDPVIAQEERERFQITDDKQAAWAMRKLAAIRKRQAEVSGIADLERERIAAWETQQIEALSGDTAYFTGLLVQYARTERDANDRKSVVLPHGSVKSRAGSRRVEIVDADAFTVWAQKNAPTLVRVRVEPDKAAIRAAIPDDVMRATNPLPVDSTTGEVMPGVSITRSEITYTVEID